VAAQPVPIASTRSPWLFGGSVDLLLGAGLAYLAAIPLLITLGSELGIPAWSQSLTIFLGLAFSAPHYGATLVRVYEKRSDRRKYALFAVYVTAVLVLAFVAGLRSLWFGSLLLTLYITWSPWHFAGQNYGIALMFLRRREVAIEPAVKRLIYASFVLSTALALLSIHGAGSHLVFAQTGTDQPGSYAVMRLGIPAAVGSVAGPLVALAWLAVLGLAALRLHRGGGAWRDLAPAGVVTLTQSLWFSVPALGVLTGAWNATSLIFAPIWISTAHAVQYLWVTLLRAALRAARRHRALPDQGHPRRCRPDDASEPALRAGPARAPPGARRQRPGARLLGREPAPLRARRRSLEAARRPRRARCSGPTRLRRRPTSRGRRGAGCRRSSGPPGR